ncbi:hypothetical protein JCGZ_08322 [Jatropha curcas]|uniref:Protein kinase domain-containing protein n=1 Tax=Jatropha curcas TaxID=180498 RepID=A0A067KWA7_JATCU|nr:hypothetical protein JCGZ_08322 [Jatropha curcas]
MRCFFCISSSRKDTKIDVENGLRSTSRHSSDSSGSGKRKPYSIDNSTFLNIIPVPDNGNKAADTSGARSFTFRELASATSNFREINLVGEGGFGRIVAVKQLNHDGVQGFQEFIVEVLMLSLLHHPNLVTLIGYCTAGDQRLLVYEYMPING